MAVEQEGAFVVVAVTAQDNVHTRGFQNGENIFSHFAHLKPAVRIV